MIKIKIFQKKALIPLIVLCVIILMIISGCTISQTGEAMGGTGIEPRCGDNIINQASEECDGSDFPDGATCESLDQLPGTLGCTALCEFDFTKCGRTSTRLAPNTFRVSTDISLDSERNADDWYECFPEGDIPIIISNGGDWLGVGEECTYSCNNPNKDCIAWLAMSDSELAEETGLSTTDDKVSYVTNSPNDELIGYSAGKVTVPPECGDGPCEGTEDYNNCPADCPRPKRRK